MQMRFGESGSRQRKPLDGREEVEAEETGEEEEEEVRSEGIGSSEESKYSTEVDYEKLDGRDEESE